MLSYPLPTLPDMSIGAELRRALLEFGTGPLLSEMPHRTLADKGIAGPTAAHVIEELHTPLNLAYVTFTTGTTAFQTPVGVTWQELPDRVAVGIQAFERCGIPQGAELLVTYPPLVNVFSMQALEAYGLKARFILRPSRDALLAELCCGARFVVGESSFLRATLQDARKLGLSHNLTENLVLIAAGTPLDPELPEEVDKLPGAQVHDLYGCQEFGWLVLDGVPLRSDITLCAEPEEDRWHLLVGGLPTGDCFRRGVHPLNPKGFICTNTKVRSLVELETTLLAGEVSSRETAYRAARTILRIKSRIVRVSNDYVCKAEKTRLSVGPPSGPPLLALDGPKATRLLDTLVQAQKQYQGQAKNDPVWRKPC